MFLHLIMIALRVKSFKKMDSVINSYTENAGVAGQNNAQVADYADLGQGLKAATIFKPKLLGCKKLIERELGAL